MNIDILRNIVSNAMEATRNYFAFCRKICSDRGLPPEDATCCISSISRIDAYRLGELCAQFSAAWSDIRQVCRLLEIDSGLLVATVKSINRWETLHDRHLCLEIGGVKDRMMRSRRINVNIDVLKNIVFTAMHDTRNYFTFCRKIRSDYGLPPEDPICISSLSGVNAYLLGERCAWSRAEWSNVMQVCRLLEISPGLLVATVKSTNRGETLHDRRLCLEISEAKYRIMRSLSEKNKDEWHYKSTGRLKSWCIPEDTQP